MDTIRRMAPGFRKETWISLFALALLWQIVSWVTPEYVAPGWEIIARSLFKLRYDWVLVTVLRVFAALWAAFVLGAGGAALLYFWRGVEGYALPLVRTAMAVPVICWILFAVLWFRGTELRVAFVLVVVSAPIFLLDLLDAVKGIPKELRDMVRSLRPTRLQFARKLLAPALLPAALTGWKVNLSLAIRVVTIAELVGATSGIGYGLTIAQAEFSIADIFAWTLVLVAILLASQQVVAFLEGRYLSWRPR